MAAKKQSSEHRALGLAARGVRGRRELSQEEVGFRCGLSRNYIGGIERGEINPTFRLLWQLASGLDIPLSRLIAEAEAVWREPHFRNHL